MKLETSEEKMMLETSEKAIKKQNSSLSTHAKLDTQKADMWSIGVLEKKKSSIFTN